MEHERVFAVGNFVIVQSETLTHAQPGVVDERGCGAVIAMIVNGPLRENDIWLFGFEQPAKLVVVGLVHDRFAVGFIREPGVRF